MPDKHLTLILLRWITALALIGIVVILGLDLAGMQGPWRLLGLTFAGVGFAAFLLVLRLTHRQMHVASAAVVNAVSVAQAAQAATGQVAVAKTAEFDALRHEIEEYRRLQRELTEAKQVAESAVLAKGEFLATMSHEVRTPLNGIIPMLDLLQSSNLALDQREILNIALQSARQLLHIVDDILDYSKLEANRLQLESVNINLRELLDSVIRLFERQAQAKGLRLALHVDPAVRPGLRGDPLRLRQVISNLVSNALKFTERGSIALNVSRLGETKTHHQLRFEVRDTGVGVLPEAASKLFSAFSQADTSTTRVYGGTGLGLAISKRIVDLMSGRIGVESEIGRGSLFWFEVPLLKAASEIEGRRIELHGARALALVSDSALRQRLTLTFAHWGVDASFVASTQDALTQLRTIANIARLRNYDFMLVDLGSIRGTQMALQRSLASMEGIDALRLVFLESNEPIPVELREMPNSIVVPRTLPDSDLRQQISRLLAGETLSGAGRESEAAVTLTPAPATTERRRDAPVQLKGRLLLVEDNPINLTVAQRLIALTGMHCETAENGEQALEKLSLGHYDIVLMDCQMPVMDGYTATRIWRRREADTYLPHLPIIAMTANAMAGDRQKCLDAGMDDYLAKPVSRQLLEETLARWLAHSERQAAAAAAQRQPMMATSTAIAARESAHLPTPSAHEGTTLMDSSPAANVPALDLEVVDDLRDAMGDQFKMLVALYLEDAPIQLAKLEAAAVLGDKAQMVSAAHTLKSSSANLGAMQVSALSKRIEHGARDMSLQNPLVAVTLLGAEYHRAEAELRKLL
jgi:signal transduction histidine kinase/CheY-like chemotaxis protein/HPt (histidine-containing phosphotransfer) domain-containing protein